jgi:hypothetical protein
MTASGAVKSIQYDNKGGAAVPSASPVREFRQGRSQRIDDGRHGDGGRLIQNSPR